MARKHKVVFIEDDKFWARGFIGPLSEEFEVCHIRYAKEVEPYFDEHVDVDAIILDIMMAPPEGKEAATGNGFWTGVWVLTKLKEYILANQVAVYVLTNADVTLVQAKIDAAADLSGLSTCISVSSKLEAKYATLPGEVLARINVLRG